MISRRRVGVALVSMAAATAFMLVVSLGDWVLSVAFVLAVGGIMLIPPDRWHNED